MSFLLAIIFRGAGFRIVWPDFAMVSSLGLALFVYSLSVFRKSIAARR